jgi:hypothetical protein
MRDHDSAATPHRLPIRFHRETLHIAFALAIIVVAAFAIGPTLTRAAVDAERASLAGSLATIRAAVEAHRHSRLVRTVESGWPAAIHPDWFGGNEFGGHEMPRHPLTGRALLVEIVDEADAIAPAVKTFAPNDGNARALWYNRTNGAVCLRVPDQADDAAALAVFNEVNGLDLPYLAARR